MAFGCRAVTQLARDCVFHDRRRNVGPNEWHVCHATGCRSSFGVLKNLYIQTDLGKLGCLGEVAGLGKFETVLRRSVVARLYFGEFRFLSLEALIEAKTAAGRERDLHAVRCLLAIKEKK